MPRFLATCGPGLHVLNSHRFSSPGTVPLYLQRHSPLLFYLFLPLSSLCCAGPLTCAQSRFTTSRFDRLSDPSLPPFSHSDSSQTFPYRNRWLT